MREFRITKKAMYFTKGNYGINIFWRDFVTDRGIVFFLQQLFKGIKLLVLKEKNDK